MYVEIEIQNKVAELLNEIKDNVKGYDVYLGGGYLRDQYCELNFKDLDIFLVPNGDKRDLIPYTPKGFSISYTKVCNDNEDMRERGVEALIGLYERTTLASPLQVQYIIYENPMHIMELAEDMDMTINQIMWSPVLKENIDSNMFECYCTDEFVDAHKYEWIEFAHEYDEVRMYCRQKRMKEKFPSYMLCDTIYLTNEQEKELYDKGEKEYEGSA